MRHDLNEFFAPFQGPLYRDFQSWQGADVAIATGWQTMHATLSFEHCRARASLVNHHKPELYATSTEHILAEDTYRHDLKSIAASPRLRDLLGSHATARGPTRFQLGVDPDTYHPCLSSPNSTGADRICAWCCSAPITAARAFPYEHFGVFSTSQLARLYTRPHVTDEVEAGMRHALRNREQRALTS